MRTRFRPTLIALLLALILPTATFVAGVRLADLNEPEGFDRIAAAGRKLLDQGARPVTVEDLVDAAIRGMLEATGDPYAALLSEDDLDALGGLVGGEEIVGIGVWLEPEGKALRVTWVIPGTPAAREGLRAGDLIVRIDGAAVETGDDPTGPLKGEAGEAVRLSVLRDGRRLELELVRALIKVPDVFPRLLPSGLGYLRIVEFGGGLARSLRREVQGLLDRGASGIVLDLRDNPGGVAHEAFEAARVFVDEGLLGTWHQRGRDPIPEFATGEALPDFPLAVLVNAYTVSASEILAAALQDRGRATIVGTKTFGKGSALSVTPIEPDGPTIIFTTAFIVRPNGGDIEGVGVTPDVQVSQTGRGDPQLRRATRLLLDAA